MSLFFSNSLNHFVIFLVLIDINLINVAEKGEPNSNFLVVGHCTSALSSAASTTQTTTSASTSSRRKLSVAERLSQNEI